MNTPPDFNYDLVQQKCVYLGRFFKVPNFRFYISKKKPTDFTPPTMTLCK